MGLDDAGLWTPVCDADEYVASRVLPAPSAETVREVERRLGVRLPATYVELMTRSQNGGLLQRNACPAPSATSWADDHVGVQAFLAIDTEHEYSLLGTYGQELWVNEWGYPRLGVYFAECPSAGHDMIALDYGQPTRSEPRVVHVDAGRAFAVTVLAESFAGFINTLVPEESFNPSN